VQHVLLDASQGGVVALGYDTDAERTHGTLAAYLSGGCPVNSGNA
jgi:hypothetical protein